LSKQIRTNTTPIHQFSIDKHKDASGFTCRNEFTSVNVSMRPPLKRTKKNMTESAHVRNKRI